MQQEKIKQHFWEQGLCTIQIIKIKYRYFIVQLTKRISYRIVIICIILHHINLAIILHINFVHRIASEM